MNKEYKRFYTVSLIALVALSAYPLYHGGRMLALSLANGALEPDQLARYVVPYAAVCAGLVLFAALQPLLLRLRGRWVLPSLMAAVYGVFFAIEQVLENIQINTNGLASIQGSHPAPRLDMWQAMSCYISPEAVKAAELRERAFIGENGFYYVVGNSAYKIHYYLISLILIVMACGLIYGLGRMFRDRDYAKKKAVILQGVSLAVLVSICAFANLTGFFCTTAPIQTPLASVLTCLFFVLLGLAAGVYTGSFLVGKGKSAALWIPSLTAAGVTVLMYVGEAVMMDGGLYRFGSGWFFAGLPGISLAPVDILIVLLSGSLTWFALWVVRNGKRATGIAAGLSAVVICAIGITLFTRASEGRTMQIVENPPISQAENLAGECYEFGDCLYMSPLSSFAVIVDGEGRAANMPYVYGFTGDAFIIANTESGDITDHKISYENTEVGEDEFTAGQKLALGTYPSLRGYTSRVLIARAGSYKIYKMDDELWLAGNMSIYRLKKTEETSIDDLTRAVEMRDALPSIEPSPGVDKHQMTRKDIYALARKGNALTLEDFASFRGSAVGQNLSLLRYDITGDGFFSIIIRKTADGSGIESVRLSKQGWDPYDEAKTVDFLAGFDAVCAYLDPLHSLMKLKIEDSHEGAEYRELIYTEEHNGYRYYLNTTRSDTVSVVLENGERLPLRQALEERRIIVEDAVANGLYNVFMEPIDNPLGGYFPILHHRFTFVLDGTAFYPTASFMYLVSDNSRLVEYFDLAELADIVEWLGKTELSNEIRSCAKADNTVSIAGRPYITAKWLNDLGITFAAGWQFSSHTPVGFSTGK